MTTKFSISSIPDVQKVGGRYLFRCPMPNHGQGRGDQNRSAEVWMDPNDRPGFKCYGGCDSKVLWTHFMGTATGYTVAPIESQSKLTDYTDLKRWALGHYKDNGEYQVNIKWSDPSNWQTYAEVSRYLTAGDLGDDYVEMYATLALAEAENGLVPFVGCIDWDSKHVEHGGWQKDFELLSQLIDRYELTPIKTRSDGRHLWFTVPARDIPYWQKTSKPTEATRIFMPHGTFIEVFGPGHRVMMRVYPVMDRSAKLPVLSVAQIASWAEGCECDASGFAMQFTPEPDSTDKEPGAVPTRASSIKTGYDLELPEWAMFDAIEATDMARVRRYSGSNILASETVLIHTAKGLWSRLESQRIGKSTGALTELVKEARRQALTELPAVLADSEPDVALEYIKQFQKAMRDTDSHWRAMTNNMIAQVGNDPVGHNVLEVAMTQFNRRRNEYPVIPLLDGGAIDLTHDGIIDAEDLSEMLMIDNSWAIPMPRFELLTNIPDQAKAMHWFIHEHLTLDLMKRIAFKLLGNRKDIDVIRIDDTNAGKDTLLDALSLTLPGAIMYEAGSKSFTETGDRFSQATVPLTKHIIYFYNEIDKLQKDIPPGQVNSMVSDILTIEEKRRMPYQVIRIGQPIMIGAGWPPIDTSAQGLDARFAWAYYRPAGEIAQISYQTRQDILSLAGIEYLRAWLINTARTMWRNGDEALTPARINDAELFISEQMSDEVQSLRECGVETRDPNDWVSTADLLKAAEIVAKGKGVAKLIHTAFPTARAQTRNNTRGWTGIAIPF